MTGLRRNVKRASVPKLFAAIVCTFVTPAAPATAGFEEIAVPWAGPHPLKGAIWYPSSTPASSMSLGLRAQTVATAGAIAGRNLPLIVISHGALGSWKEHTDTAVALARAGFVAAAITHDEIALGPELKVEGRSQQLSALIDFALHDWGHSPNIDAKEIGVFGFSLGGFTALVAVGGKPDTQQIMPHCRLEPTDWPCDLAKANKLDIAESAHQTFAWTGDPRIKAAVLAAPALGYLFGAKGLAPIHIPVQIWQASQDHTFVEPYNVQAIKQNLPESAEYNLIEGAGHADLTAPCTPESIRTTPRWCVDAIGFNGVEFHQKFNAAIINFFRRALGQH
jgi:predicted dienelactone hydrolase